MLSQKIFKKGLEDLKDSFDTFKITEGKIKTWYKIVKEKIEDGEWEEMILDCIVNCHRTPTLADVLDLNDYYKKGRK